jgi:hypothetical protein
MLVLLCVFTMAFVSPSFAIVGEYEVGACTEAVGYVNHSWRPFDSDSHYLEANSGCNEAPAHELSARLANLSVGDVLGAGDPPVGVEAGWRFTAPTGTTISEVRGSDDLFKDTDNSWNVYLSNANNNVLGGQTCMVELRSSFYCEVSGSFQESGVDTPSVAIGVVCIENSFNNCPGGATIHEVRAELDYATVTISDPIVPTNVAVAAIPTVPQHGTVAILGSASDTTAGLLSLSVVNGASEVVGGPVSAPTACDYSFTTPCPTEVNDLAIPVDTTKLPNGQDQIRIEATNAAHDEGFSPVYTIDVENSLPKQDGGTGPPSGEGSGSGSKNGGLNELPTNPGDNKPSQGPGGQPASVANLPLPVPRLTAKVARSARGGLIVSGLISKGATGTLTLVARGIGRGHHIWTHKATVAIKHGHFSFRLRLPRGIGRGSVRIRLSYPGGLFFGPTRASLSIRPRHGQTDR